MRTPPRESTGTSGRLPIFPNAAFDLIAIASSAGGIGALKKVFADLQPLPAALLVVHHLPRTGSSVLPAVLRHNSLMPVEWAKHGEVLTASSVRIAPAAHDVVVDSDLRLEMRDVNGASFVQPDANVTLRSVAEAVGSRAIALILSGAGTDGAAGAEAIREAGGVVIVEDPSTAEFAGMPAASARHAHLVLPLERIPSALHALVSVPGGREFFVA